MSEQKDNKIIDIQAYQPHVTLEVICVKCYRRVIAVAPAKVLLKDYECKTCGPGYIIMTGQPLSEV